MLDRRTNISSNARIRDLAIGLDGGVMLACAGSLADAISGPWCIDMTFAKAQAFAFDGWIADALVSDRELPPNEHVTVVQKVSGKWSV